MPEQAWDRGGNLSQDDWQFIEYATTDEIEVTEAMIDAGLAAASLYDKEDPKEWEIAAVYRAMEATKQSTSLWNAAVIEETEEWPCSQASYQQQHSTCCE